MRSVAFLSNLNGPKAIFGKVPVSLDPRLLNVSCNLRTTDSCPTAALQLMGRLPDAFEAFRSGLEVDPTNEGLKQAFDRVSKISKEEEMEKREVDDTLHCLCKAGRADEVKDMLASNINVNERDSQKSTPLHYAASEGMIGIMHMLLEAGADVNARNAAQNTPLHLAAWNGRCVPCRARFVIAIGLEIWQDSKCGRSHGT